MRVLNSFLSVLGFQNSTPIPTFARSRLNHSRDSYNEGRPESNALRLFAESYSSEANYSSSVGREPEVLKRRRIKKKTRRGRSGAIGELGLAVGNRVMTLRRVTTLSIQRRVAWWEKSSRRNYVKRRRFFFFFFSFRFVTLSAHGTKWKHVTDSQGGKGEKRKEWGIARRRGAIWLETERKYVEQTAVTRDYLEWYLELFLPHSATVKTISVISHRNADPWSSRRDRSGGRVWKFPKTAWYCI